MTDIEAMTIKAQSKLKHLLDLDVARHLGAMSWMGDIPGKRYVVGCDFYYFVPNVFICMGLSVEDTSGRWVDEYEYARING